MTSKDSDKKIMTPLFKPYMPQLEELSAILMSGSLASGKYTSMFEECLKKYFKQDYVLVTNTFSSAISVATAAIGLGFGDEVIASPMGCLVSTQPYVASGFKIKWCDVDPMRGTLSPDVLRSVISSKTKAIIHNHFCGYPGYIDEINAIGKEYGIPVIDDGIECFGSEYKGKKIGACGTDVTVFALSAVRIPNTIDGGVIIFKDKKHYDKAVRIRDCGIDRSRFRDELGEINPYCDITEIGYSATMSNVNAYIGLRQMDCAQDLIAKQRANAMKWKEVLKNNSEVTPIENKDICPNYWVYGIRAKNKTDCIKNFRDSGYYASGVHVNNNIYSVFGDKTELPGASDFHNHFVALPCGWWMEEQK